MIDDFYYELFFYFLVVYLFYKYSFQYFPARDVPVIGPSFPFGNVTRFLRPKRPRYDQLRELHATFKIRGHRHGGIYLFFKPLYMPVDHDYVRTVLVDKFDHFSDRPFEFADGSENLFGLNGRTWKEARVRLTPAFRGVNGFAMCAGRALDGALGLVESARPGPVEVGELAGRIASDLNSSVVYGADSNSYNRKSKSPVAKLKKIFDDHLRLTLSILFPSVFKLKLLKGAEQRRFEDAIRRVIDFRGDNGVKKIDFLQNLIELFEAREIGFGETVSACLLPEWIGGETIAATITFCVYELCKDAAAQERARAEIESVLGADGNVGHDQLNRMVYLQQIIDETLRLYPPVPAIFRRCTKPYKLPESKEYLGRGTGVVISVLGIHRDPDVYPEPEKFDPARFDEAVASRRHPFSYIPYGEGPRICPAIKLANLQLKVALVKLIRNYRFKLSPKTKNVALSKKRVLMTPKTKIYVEATRI